MPNVTFDRRERKPKLSDFALRTTFRSPPGFWRTRPHRSGSLKIQASRLYGRVADALAAAGDEGRGKLR